MNFVWRPLAAGARCFVYSPRFGATYLLAPGQTDNPILMSWLGLRSEARADQLDDPVVRVGIAGSNEKDLSPALVAEWASAESSTLLRSLSRRYWLIHRFRHLFSPRHAHRWARLATRAVDGRNLSLEQIARLVAVTERVAGFSDCYPRALLTGALCAAGGFGFSITIGILAPTRKLHAWCSSGGTLVYEPTPRHWWYEPLADFRYRLGR